MATMLLSLGKRVTMVTDRRALDMNQAIIDEAVKTGEPEFEIKKKKTLIHHQAFNPVSLLKFFIEKKIILSVIPSFRCAENSDSIGHL